MSTTLMAIVWGRQKIERDRLSNFVHIYSFAMWLDFATVSRVTTG